ncbi:secretion system protein E [Thermoplasmatales archaeon SW_10_69_26]|nr:MAG: secretion system protein E [Thermoplasmatales archaeon SW_10_69_26]
MESLPFDEFLQTLAAHDVYPDPSHIQETDVEAIWANLDPSDREALMREIGLPVGEMTGLEPRMEDAEVVFDVPGSPASGPDPEDVTARDTDEPVGPQAGPGNQPQASPFEDPDAGEAGEADPAIEAADAFSEIDPDQMGWLGEGTPLTDDPEAGEGLEDMDEPVEDAAAVEPVVEEPGPEEPDAEPADADAIGSDDGGLPDERGLPDADTVPAPDDADVDGGVGAADVEQLEGGEALETVDAAEMAEIEVDELDDGAVEEIVEDESRKDSRREVEIYPVYEPYGYVRILYDEEDHQYLYEVIEPELTEREEKVLDFIQETIVDVIEVGLSRLTEEEAEEMLVDLTSEIIEDYSIEVDEKMRMRLTYYIVRDFLGYGKLDVIMRDPMIEDISCDGVGIPIFLYHRKYESMASTVSFEEENLDSFVIKLAQRSGKHISVADPLLDARLPDGSRLNATLSDEVTTSGSTFTIRKFRDEPFTPTDLLRFGTLNPKMLAYYWLAIQHGASMIVAGGTASGKTTMLNAVMLFIPPQMKIVSIEDTRELNLPHPNWIPGTTRSGFGPRDDSGRQAGEINMFELLKAALRQRPEYITVGEVRGEEATVLFQAMATGHAAYGTMHADSVTSVIHRLEGEPINIPRPLLEALDIVSIQIQTRIGGQRVRRTQNITEIVGMDPNTKELLTNEVFEWDPADDTFDHSGISYVLERIQKENNMTDAELETEVENRTLLIEWMKEHGVRDYVDVGTVVQSYYNEPEETVHKIKVDMGLEEPEEGEEDIELEDELLEDREIKGAGEKGDEFDPTADIPAPEDASLVAPLEDETLDSMQDMGGEFDPVEATQEGSEEGAEDDLEEIDAVDDLEEVDPVEGDLDDLDPGQARTLEDGDELDPVDADPPPNDPDEDADDPEPTEEDELEDIDKIEDIIDEDEEG